MLRAANLPCAQEPRWAIKISAIVTHLMQLLLAATKQ
jgi:hypothetical protein